MRRFFMFCLIGTTAIYLAANIFPGIRYEGITGLLMSGIILAMIILLFRPIIMVMILPLNLLTLGLLGVVINTWIIQITALISGGLQVAGFWSALGVVVIWLMLDWALKGLLRIDRLRANE